MQSLLQLSTGEIEVESSLKAHLIFLSMRDLKIFDRELVNDL